MRGLTDAEAWELSDYANWDSQFDEINGDPLDPIEITLLQLGRLEVDANKDVGISARGRLALQLYYAGIR